jgi:hypothetical protein
MLFESDQHYGPRLVWCQVAQPQKRERAGEFQQAFVGERGMISNFLGTNGGFVKSPLSGARFPFCVSIALLKGNPARIK